MPRGKRAHSLTGVTLQRSRGDGPGTTLEVERKFLVVELPADIAQHPAHELRQGYLVTTPAGLEVRVRATDGVPVLTIKGAGSLTRVEVEVPISAEQFTALWPLTDGRRVEKRRTRYPLGGRTAEIDEFAGALAPLRLVEVEFPSEEAALAFEPPSWFGREVTGDGRYKNKNLALTGPP
jgi:adenylate cyclase